ncbi:hypothetical protein GCM10010836_01620 [Aminobacter aminovorans]
MRIEGAAVVVTGGASGLGAATARHRASVAPAIKAVGREFMPHPVEAFRKAIEINLVGICALGGEHRLESDVEWRNDQAGWSHSNGSQMTI